MSKIGHAASDERGKYSCGKAGDQTGKEVCTRTWYNRPWNVVLIHPDSKVREAIAKAMEAACANDHIGYDQDASNTNDAGRYSLFKEARKVGFDLSKIKNNCETDCSNLVAACCNAAGLEVSEYIYTGNEKSALTKVGFKAYTDSKYLTSPDYLPRGAVLLYEGHHTAINLEDGKNVEASTTAQIEYKEVAIVANSLEVVGAASLNVRKAPSTDSTIVKSLKRGTKVSSKAKAKVGETWWFNIGKDQWISGKYIEGWIKETTDDNQSWYVKLGYTYDTNKVVSIGGKQYIFDKNGYRVEASRLAADGSIKY